MTRILALLAESLVLIGNVDRAQAHLQEGLEVLTVRNDHQGMMTALRVKGLLHRRLHDFGTAGDYLAESLRMAREIGSQHGEVMTLLEMAQLIIALTQSRSGIVFQPLPEDDPKVRQPDVTRARKQLGWEPQVDVREALRLTIDWFRRPS